MIGHWPLVIRLPLASLFSFQYAVRAEYFFHRNRSPDASAHPRLLQASKHSPPP
jgi:hypothetical protein